jgi:long-chain acyl-CoA synthetase
MIYPTFVQDYFENYARLYPNKEALIVGEERWTYSSINYNADQLGLFLLEIGIRREDRVIIYMENSSELVISIYGILKAAGVFVIINSQVQANKLAYIIQDSGAVVLIAHVSKSEVVKKALNVITTQCKIIWVGSKLQIPKSLLSSSFGWEDIFTNAGKQEYSAYKRSSVLERIDADCINLDLAALIYTSGSTGEPKGVMSTHINIISAAHSIIQYIENTEDDIILNTLPLSFDYGLYQIIMAFMFGGTVVLEKSFIFITDIIKLIRKEQVTGFPIVPTIIAMLLKIKNLNEYDFSSLKYITNTGAALPIEHIKRIRNELPDVRIYSMFGLTECKRVCYLHPDEIDKRPDSVGKAMPNCEVFIVDEKEKEVKPGEIGELVVRGLNVMKGYWNSPYLTAKYFRPGLNFSENLLFTGDYFKKDEEGYLYFIGRKDDMIKSRGERLSAKEIENVIYQIKGIIEVAVTGVPDEILGQAIKAFIVKEDSSNISERYILEYCSQNLELFAIPKYIEFVDKIPKTPHGKIDKLKLKKNY